MAWALVKRERLLSPPFLVTVVFMAWVLPQLIVLTLRQEVPASGLQKAAVVSLLCLAGFLVGYAWPRKRKVLLNWKPTNRDLMVLCCLLAVVGGLAYSKTLALAPDAYEDFGGAWTGPITIYAFFKALVPLGFATSFLLYLRSKSKLAFALTIFNGVLLAYLILVLGRRAETAGVILTYALAMFFLRGWTPSRWVMVSTIFVGALWVLSIGQYRDFVVATDVISWSRYFDLVFSTISISNFDDFLSFVFASPFDLVSSEEMKNVSFYLEAIDREGKYGFGATIWNSLVVNFVPGQILGNDFKNGLQVLLGDPAFDRFGYVRWPGSTLTGMVDAYWDFWYFAPIKFGLVGFFLRRLFVAAKENDVVAQLLMLGLIVPALHMVTHSVNWFFNELVYATIFLVAPLYILGLRRRPRHVYATL
jgi:hypothetical protein